LLPLEVINSQHRSHSDDLAAFGGHSVASHEHLGFGRNVGVAGVQVEFEADKSRD
jgi:hypothetical protein